MEYLYLIFGLDEYKVFDDTLKEVMKQIVSNKNEVQ